LSWRHDYMVQHGASHDYTTYQPHLTISYNGDGVDLSRVEPYRGPLEFGAEQFREIDLRGSHNVPDEIPLSHAAE